MDKDEVGNDREDSNESNEDISKEKKEVKERQTFTKAEEDDLVDAFKTFVVAKRTGARVDPQVSFDKRAREDIVDIQAGVSKGHMYKQRGEKKWEVTARNGGRPMKLHPQGEIIECESRDEVIKFLNTCIELNARGKFASIYEGHKKPKAKWPE